MDGFKMPRPRPGEGERPRTTSPSLGNNIPPLTRTSPGQNSDVQHMPPQTAQDIEEGNNSAPGNSSASRNPQPKRSKKWLWIGVVAGVLLIFLFGALGWYAASLRPVDTASQNEVDVTILPQTSYGFAMKSLKEKNLIRSDIAATMYGYVTGKKNDLKEGSCRVKASQSTQEIVDVLTKGCNEFKSVTFLPGATIEQPLYKPEHAQLDQTMNIRNVLKRSGYSDAQVASALSKSYSGPLFEGKPEGSSLEGYIYGDTYHVDPEASAETVLQTAFDQMYKDVQKYDLESTYASKGLNLFQGITLASIIQRELNCEGKFDAQGTRDEARTDRCYQYQRTIAQIFLKRLKEDIQLGSDVTFIYAADQMKVMPRVDLDSPYNTRKYSGLPPGPIASPGVHALRALADPTPTEYVYFIAGDDGLIYFAKTEAEHQKNIKNHCQKLCNEL